MAIDITELAFRTGTPADLPALKELGLLSYGQYASALPPGGWEQMKANLSRDDFWVDLMRRGTCFLCTHLHNLVGMAFYIPHGNEWDVYPADWSYIRSIGVHPQYEGMGIGRKLTQRCIEEARATGEHMIALHTSEIMNAARHIYESIGFKISHEIPGRFGIKYWLFTLPLTPLQVG